MRKLNKSNKSNKLNKLNMKWLAAALALGFCLVTLACNPTPADTSAADAAALQKADEAWSASAQTKSIDTWMSYYTADAVLLPGNVPSATTPADIRKNIEPLLALPGLTIGWKATKVEVAKSGELGYLYGTYQMSWDDGKGGKASENGKMTEVWRKQADGSWKCVVDSFSSDAPPPPVTPAAPAKKPMTKPMTKPMKTKM